MDTDGDREMPFLEHLRELRERILKSILAVLVLFLPAYYFSKDIFGLLMKPIVASLPEGSILIFTRPAEGFTTYLKVSFFAALVGAFPVILYQGWKFVAPALYKEEKRILVPFVLFGTIFFATGALFCYFVAAPPAFRFLLGEYSSDIVKPFPSIGEALSFFITLIISFGVVFEFPVITFVLSRLGIVDARWLKEKRKYALLLSTIAAAVVTPTTDALSMIVMLAPILVFYELGIVVARLFGKKKRIKEEGISPLGEENLAG